MNRRRVATGLAWAVPVIAVASAAPAFAQSVVPCTPSGCPSGSFTSSGGALPNGWTVATTGSFYGGNFSAIGLQTSGITYVANDNKCGYTSQNQRNLGGPIAVAQGDPSSANSTVTLAKTFCLQSGRNYRFTYDWISFNANPIGAYQSTYIALGSSANSGTQLGSTIAATARTPNNSATTVVNYVPSATSLYTFYFRWTFDTATSYPGTNGCTTFANDFAIRAPAIACT